MKKLVFLFLFFLFLGISGYSQTGEFPYSLKEAEVENLIKCPHIIEFSKTFLINPKTNKSHLLDDENLFIKPKTLVEKLNVIGESDEKIQNALAELKSMVKLFSDYNCRSLYEFEQKAYEDFKKRLDPWVDQLLQNFREQYSNYNFQNLNLLQSKALADIVIDKIVPTESIVEIFGSSPTSLYRQIAFCDQIYTAYQTSDEALTQSVTISNENLKTSNNEAIVISNKMILRLRLVSFMGEKSGCGSRVTQRDNKKQLIEVSYKNQNQTANEEVYFQTRQELMDLVGESLIP